MVPNGQSYGTPGLSGGPTPYGAAYGAPAYLPPPRVPAGLATSTIVLAVVVTAVQALAWVMSFGAAEDVRDAIDGNPGTFAAANSYDALNVLLACAQIAAGVVACVWLWKSRVFAEAVTPGAYHARSRVWVWLGWCVPVVAWWFPFQVVRDVGRATLRREPASVGLWWTGWHVFAFASNAAGRAVNASTIDALPALETVATAGLAVALAGWIRIIRDLTGAQRTYGV